VLFFFFLFFFLRDSVFWQYLLFRKYRIELLSTTLVTVESFVVSDISSNVFRTHGNPWSQCFSLLSVNNAFGLYSPTTMITITIIIITTMLLLLLLYIQTLFNHTVVGRRRIVTDRFVVTQRHPTVFAI